MMNMDDNEMTLFREIQKDNVWWSLGDVPEALAKPFKRSDYHSYKALLESDKINVLIGPRQIGKSTVIYQLINYLLKEKGVPPKRILFLSLERSFFQINKDPIREALKIYEENILMESLSALKDPIYLFVDEASRNANWALTLKQFKSDLKYNINCFVSGSSAPALYQAGVESLVGRKNDIVMLPLKFRDVLRLQNPNVDRTFQVLAWKLRTELVESIVKGQPEVFFKGIKRLYTSISPETELALQISLNEYLLKGGYPEFYDKKMGWDESSKIMREAYFDAIISYDVMKVFGSRNPDNLKKLYIILAISTANVINMTTIGNDIGHISRNALDEYFRQLQETYLIDTSLSYKKKRSKIGNELKKVYAHDVGMRNAVLGITEDEIKAGRDIGHLAETVAYNHIRRLKFVLEKEKPNEVFFWRDSSNKELDFIVEIKDKIIPIEVKFQESIRSDDVKVLRNAIEEFKSPLGILITKKSINLSDKIVSMPLWLLLLFC